MLRKTAVLCCAASLLTVSGWAAEPDLIRAEIHVNHKDGTYSIRNFNQRDNDFRSRALEDKNSTAIVLRPGERVTVYVDDPDQFFYSYSWSLGGSTSTSNAEAFQTFSNGVLSLIKGLDPQKGSSALVPMPLRREPSSSGVAMAAFQQSPLEELRQAQSQVVGWAAMSSAEIVQDAAAQLRATTAAASPAEAFLQMRAQDIIEDAARAVRSKPAPRPGKQKVREILSKAGIPDSTTFLQGFKASLTKLYLFDAQKDQLLRDVDAGFGDRAKSAVGAWTLDNVAKEISDAYNKMHAAGEALQGALSVETDLRAAARLADLGFGDDPHVGPHEVAEKLGRQLALNEQARNELKAAISILEACPDGTGQTAPKEIRSLLSALGEGEHDIFRAAWPEAPYRLARVEVNFAKLGEDPETMLYCPLVQRRAGRSLETLTAVESRKYLEHAQTKFSILAAEAKELKDLQDKATALEAVEENLARDPFYLSLSFILPQETPTLTLARDLQKFKDTMTTKVNVPLKIGEMEYTANLVNTATFKVEKVATLPGDTRLTRAVRDFSFEFVPFSAVSLGVGAAMTYSYVKPHKFAASPRPDGRFQIADTAKNDFSGTNVAVMLTILPKAWAASDFHPILEIGVNPESNLALFGGFGIQMTKIFSFGFGVAFEQVDELSGNLKVGDILTSASDLKTEKRFQPGFYFHLTAAATIKK